MDCALLPERAGPETAAHLTENRLAALGGPGHAALLARGLDRLFWMVFVNLGASLLLRFLRRAVLRASIITEDPLWAQVDSTALPAVTLLWALASAYLTWRGLRWLREGFPGYRPALRWWLASTAGSLLFPLVRMAAIRRLPPDAAALGAVDLAVTTLGTLLSGGYAWTLYGATAQALRAVGHRRARVWRALRALQMGQLALSYGLYLATRRTMGTVTALCAVFLMAAGLAMEIVFIVQLRRTANTFRRLAAEASRGSGPPETCASAVGCSSGVNMGE